MSRLSYFATYLALMALLALTYGTTAISLGPLADYKPVINIGIGAVKAAIILLFFMHLIKAEPLTKAAGAVGYLWIVLMFILGFSDYLWR